jgi:hypothetical protein
MKVALLKVFHPPTAPYTNTHYWSMQMLHCSENQPSTPPTHCMNHMVPKSTHVQTGVNANQKQRPKNACLRHPKFKD